MKPEKLLELLALVLIEVDAEQLQGAKSSLILLRQRRAQLDVVLVLLMHRDDVLAFVHDIPEALHMGDWEDHDIGDDETPDLLVMHRRKVLASTLPRQQVVEVGGFGLQEAQVIFSSSKLRLRPCQSFHRVENWRCREGLVAQ